MFNRSSGLNWTVPTNPLVQGALTWRHNPYVGYFHGTVSDSGSVAPPAVAAVVLDSRTNPNLGMFRHSPPTLGAEEDNDTKKTIPSTPTDPAHPPVRRGFQRVLGFRSMAGAGVPVVSQLAISGEARRSLLTANFVAGLRTIKRSKFMRSTSQNSVSGWSDELDPLSRCPSEISCLSITSNPTDMVISVSRSKAQLLNNVPSTPVNEDDDPLEGTWTPLECSANVEDTAAAAISWTNPDDDDITAITSASCQCNNCRVTSTTVATTDSGDGVVDDEVCAICISAYEDGDELLTLACGHRFHGRCVRQWFFTEALNRADCGSSFSCPHCRQGHVATLRSRASSVVSGGDGIEAAVLAATGESQWLDSYDFLSDVSSVRSFSDCGVPLRR